MSEVAIRSTRGSILAARHGSVIVSQFLRSRPLIGIVKKGERLLASPHLASGGAAGGSVILNHIVLIGDSIFDNASYVNGGLDVIAHLRNEIPCGWKATLCAVDGSIVSAIQTQVANIPSNATHLIISAGGNDAINEAGILDVYDQSTVQTLNRMADISDEFEAGYRGMLIEVLQLGLPTAVCTIYYPRFPDSFINRAACMALGLFNDVIIRSAFTAGAPLIDLRLVCEKDEDFANPIEPSDSGGKKIAAAICRLVSEHDFSKGRTEVF
ncbi:MAG TPA: SGNH/GDSL hydrolase family protein [Blastocatellia bacterium]|nr:SGNH/GDSL hydrolase family protein [Blastocatellia bacterium]